MIQATSRVLLILVLTTGCGGDQGTTRTPSATFLRDSLVNDSVARSIDTDSLARLFTVLMAGGPNAPALEQEVGCESFRHGWRYGWTPAMLALIRVQDSLAKTHGRAWRKFNERGMVSVVTSVSPDLRGVAGEPPAPLTIGETRLDRPVESPR